MSRHVWLGLDTSVAAFGYCVMGLNVHGRAFVVRAGVWKTKIDRAEGKLDDRARRVAELGDLLLELVDAEKPGVVFVEDLALGMKTSRATAQTMGRIRGLVEGVCRARRIELSAVRPHILKKACTGRADASKEEVRDVVSRLYSLAAGGDLNATDAVATAHVGAHRSGLGVSSGVVSYRRDVEADDALDF